MGFKVNPLLTPAGYADGTKLVSLFCFLFRVSDDAKIDDKMFYASTKDNIKKAFTGLSLEFGANNKGDLNYEAIREEVLQKS